MGRKSCLHCKELIVGRTDKLYCSLKCKNEYSYHKKSTRHEAVIVIDKILHKNRKIMVHIFDGETKKHFKVPKLLLSKLGFDFSYYTGTYLNKQGKRYYYVYDFAWMEFSIQEIMLVKGKGIHK